MKGPFLTLSERFGPLILKASVAELPGHGLTMIAWERRLGW